MDNIYFFMVIALAVLAIADLVVGVSNDAVNFLNSAIGSKAISFKTIMIVASLGIAFGAMSSSGMMEVARKGIFVPSEFYFDEIMIIFMAVMITDILLLDFFNTLGMPTSTTVSIVFELLGAAVVMSLIKIAQNNEQSLLDLATYINTSKATEIILGILLSVLIAFSVGAIVQYVSRLLLTFKFEDKAPWVGALFGGIAATSITYFIFIKGLKGTSFIPENITTFVFSNTLLIVAISFVIWTVLSALITNIFKISVYKFIIIIGTFAIAMAFAGNDLVNFIGVPIGGWQAYEAWHAAWLETGIAASEFKMGALAKKVPTPQFLLFGAGIIMVVTLWFSSKAKAVLKTSIDLSSQDSVKERFQPNFLSRGIVRTAKLSSNTFSSLLPQSAKNKIEKQYKKPVVILQKGEEAPAFDMVRAAINLVVASILISVATSLKLPLSTTYVTFMVAMGTSLADRAWGSESAVYRVAGVLNVIGGWFFTAFSAFVAAGIVAFLIQWNVKAMVPVLLLLAVLLLIRSYLAYKKKSTTSLDPKSLKKHESSTVQGIISESAHNISNVVSRTNKIYTEVLKGLAKEDVKKLKKSKTGVDRLDTEIEELRDNIFYFIKNLDETSVRGSNFYITILAYLTDMAQSLEYISKKSYKHVSNNHKKLRFSQIKDLQEIDQKLTSIFTEIVEIFDSGKFERISYVLSRKEELVNQISEKIHKQIERTRTEEESPKNTTLYFNILMETKDLANGVMNLMEEYHSSYKKE
ncbi:hypothetical protein SCB49_07217 [unidentified eubacterium SCB49]|nr:hypothetical protein SCB49_07217 [unidentified eubacterium SCB49]